MTAPATHPLIRCDRPGCQTRVEAHVRRCRDCRNEHGPATPYRPGIAPTARDATYDPAPVTGAAPARRRVPDTARELHDRPTPTGGTPSATGPGTDEGCDCRSAHPKTGWFYMGGGAS
jgi:hypothetical protein